MEGGVMMMKSLVSTALAVGVLTSGCGILGPSTCTSELSSRVTPTSATLQVGETVTASAEATTCGGKKSLPVDIRWSSEDGSVASVGKQTGVVTGVGPGATRIVGVDQGEYHIGTVYVQVTVHAP